MLNIHLAPCRTYNQTSWIVLLAFSSLLSTSVANAAFNNAAAPSPGTEWGYLGQGTSRVSGNRQAKKAAGKQNGKNSISKTVDLTDKLKSSLESSLKQRWSGLVAESSLLSSQGSASRATVAYAERWIVLVREIAVVRKKFQAASGSVDSKALDEFMVFNIPPDPTPAAVEEFQKVLEERVKHEEMLAAKAVEAKQKEDELKNQVALVMVAAADAASRDARAEEANQLKNVEITNNANAAAEIAAIENQRNAILNETAAALNRNANAQQDRTEMLRKWKDEARRNR